MCVRVDGSVNAHTGIATEGYSSFKSSTAEHATAASKMKNILRVEISDVRGREFIRIM